MRVANIRKYIPIPGEKSLYVGRGKGERGKYGNPFVIGLDGDRGLVIWKFEQYLLQNFHLVTEIEALNPEVLLCFCHPQPRHAEIYIK